MINKTTNRMKLTKNDMARLIATALFDTKELVKADNWKVIKIAKLKKEHLIADYNKSIQIINERTTL